MKKLAIFISLLVVLSVLLGFLISNQISRSREKTEKAAFFSTETRAICEELKEPNCYYKCHDEVFLVLSGKEMNIYRSNEYVCHEEGWVDPRIKR